MNTIQLAFAQPWAERLGWTLLHFIWQGTLIAVLFSVLQALAGHRLGAKRRYMLACLSLAAMVLAPLATYGVMAVLDIASSSGIASATLRPLGVNHAGAPTQLARSGAWQQILPWLVMAWTTGVLLFSLRIIASWLSTERLRRVRTRPAPGEWQCVVDGLIERMGISRAVELVVSSIVEAPIVIGWFRPVILMPVGVLAGLAAEQVEALLAHELAHVLRRDYLVNLMQSMAEAVLFYHPVVWWVSNQIRQERELCCDDLAVAASGDVLTYARALAELESCRPAHWKTAVAANQNALLARVARLLGEPQPMRHTSPGSAAAWTFSILLLAGIGAAGVRAAQDQPRQTSAGQEVTVSRDALWVDTVKLGDLTRAVRGLGTLTSQNTAEIQIAETQIKEIKAGQSVALQTRNGTAFAGIVMNVREGVTNGTVTVDIQVPIAHPAQTGQDVDGTIELERMRNVVYVGRPVKGQADAEATLYKLEPDGKQAVRVKVQFGKSSVNVIEIRTGLQPGDKVILSDSTAFTGHDRINLK